MPPPTLLLRKPEHHPRQPETEEASPSAEVLIGGAERRCRHHQRHPHADPDRSSSNEVLVIVFET